MVPLSELWLPILVSAIAVFVVSSVIHMALPIHKNDYRKMPGEASVLAAMRAQKVLPGEYMFPCAASMKDMGTPEMQAKLKEGPVGVMSIMPNGGVRLGRALLQWFVFSVAIGLLVAYLAALALPRGVDFHLVFRFTSAAAFLGHATSAVHNSIWKGVSWGTAVKFMIDGLIYGLTTGAVFGWMWPAT
ncbi:MAG: hypothetical protein AB7O84_23570 [Planctomycetota bacterium]